ncbi:hypothetical protein [Streptomyces sp. MNP-20]|uniref:hypothetical protein n=1 Tax=Streptomyces sp. MNP-20 TaxID=2721165 RepID=UPI00155325CB|nr:hypothetical protein [Streptomyces sp. MNP-20]
MRLARFHEFAREALSKAPEVQTVNAWDGRSFGLLITFATGSQIAVGITAAAAPGDKGEGPEVPVHGDAPAETAYPELYESGKITPARAQDYLVAALANSGCDEIQKVYAYASTSSHPGFGVVFHDGARAFCLFEGTARSGQGISSRGHDIPSSF